MDLTTLPARERILLAAHDLFYRDGVRATGVDRIIAASGVAKLTFYRHFPSKDALVLAFLEHRHEVWMAWFVDALGQHGAKPGGGTRPLVQAMHEWFDSEVFRGCAFINAVTELGPALPGAVDIARRHKAEMVEVIAALLPADTDRAAAADAMGAAVDGAIVRAQMGSAADRRMALQSLHRLLALLEQAAH